MIPKSPADLRTACVLASLLAAAGCAPSVPTGDPSGTGGYSAGSGGAGSGGIPGTGGGPSGTGGVLGTGGSPGSGTGGTGTGGTGTGGAGAGGRGGATIGTGGRGGGTPGTGGTPTGSAGAGGRVAPSTDPATFGLNGPSKCGAGNFAICEDFEATAVGAIPAGWAKEGTWVTAVSDVEKARGSHALRINVDVVNNGRGFLNKTAAQLGSLASKHYGRIFYKLQNPPNLFVHWDFFHGPGPFNGGTNDVRWGFTGTGGPTHTGTFTYLFNVQPSAVPEFGINSPAAVRLIVDTWTCVEWLLDSTAAGGGEARFWVNGSEVTNMHRTGAQAQIPIFTRYGIGWELFNTTDTPSVAFIDEVVFDSQPIGCNN